MKPFWLTSRSFEYSAYQENPLRLAFGPSLHKLASLIGSPDELIMALSWLNLKKARHLESVMVCLMLAAGFCIGGPLLSDIMIRLFARPLKFFIIDSFFEVTFIDGSCLLSVL